MKKFADALAIASIWLSLAFMVNSIARCSASEQRSAAYVKAYKAYYDCQR